MENLRNIVPATARATWYTVAGALVAALVAFGMFTEEEAVVIGGVVTAVVTLVFAIVHATSSWRVALYALAAAVGALCAFYGYGTDNQVAAVLAVIAPMLGIGTAGAATNASGE